MSKPLHAFITKKNVISNLTTWNENTLVGVDDVTEDSSESIRDGTCYYFVRDIAQTDGSKIFHGVGILDLSNKRDDSGIPGVESLAIIENFEDVAEISSIMISQAF